MPKYETDRIGYTGAESGCEVATDYLGGKQSYCLSCPFEECIYDGEKECVRGAYRKRGTIKRNEEILEKFNEGFRIKQLMGMFNMSDSGIRYARDRARNGIKV